VIIRQVRKEPDVMCRIEEYNYALFWFLIWFRFLFSGYCVAGKISIWLPSGWRSGLVILSTHLKNRQILSNLRKTSRLLFTCLPGTTDGFSSRSTRFHPRGLCAWNYLHSWSNRCDDWDHGSSQRRLCVHSPDRTEGFVFTLSAMLFGLDLNIPQDQPILANSTNAMTFQ
jgi:hypothetical protein